MEACQEILKGGGAYSSCVCQRDGINLKMLRAEHGRMPGYVEGGGAYLGLCAGAYYACRRVEFELGTRHALYSCPSSLISGLMHHTTVLWFPACMHLLVSAERGCLHAMYSYS